MKLRTKLLLGVGILLLIMAILMYTLPTYFIREDLSKTTQQIHDLLVQDHEQLLKSQQLWLSEVFERYQANANSILFVLNEEPSFSSRLAFTKDNPLIHVWEGIARVAGFDPDIGFVQAHSTEQNETAIVSPHFTNFFPAAYLSSKDGIDVLALHIPQKGSKVIYAGIPLPKELQSEPGHILYALLEMKKISEETKEIQEEIKKLTPEIIKEHLEQSKKLLFTVVEERKGSYYWAIKIDMIRALAPLFVEGLELKFENKKFVPDGIARIDKSGNGLAILTEEAFQTTPLFNDVDYYESHPPKPNSPPLATSSFLIGRREGEHAFVGNTLLIKNTFLSVGIPLDRLVKQLALSSNKIIIMKTNETFFLGFNGRGQKLPSSDIESIVKSGLFDQNSGKIEVGEKIYFFDRINSLKGGNLIFYELRPGEEQTIINTLLKLQDRLSSRISIQLFLIAIGTIILVLLFIARMGFSVISPIRKLAQATEDIVAGKYEEVKLPAVGKRKDEVAILTHSFEAMVHGLQDRERIRGVLDKVVSKDVADEILRTQIHLGGEDRVVTMLFSDIRGFTELTENTTPQKTIQMLNGCMTKISRVIEGEGGVIDKYVGDEVMAIFGAPTTHPDHALRAVSSGMLIVETLKRWNDERAQDGELPIAMGIGIHTGLVVAGNMGAEDRLNYTVLGSNVNLAARLCEVAAPNELIISEATLNEPNIAESFYVKPLDPIVLKGFKEPVSIYQVIGFKWDET